MMPAAVSVPGDPNGAPVNDSIAAPMETGRRARASGRCRRRSTRCRPRPSWLRFLSRAGGPARASVSAFAGCAWVVLSRKDIHHHIGGFQPDGKAARSAAGMPRARIERPVRLQHRDGGEVEVPLPVRTALADGLDDARRLPHRVPVDAIFARGERFALRRLPGAERTSVMRSTGAVSSVSFTIAGPTLGAKRSCRREIVDAVQHRDPSAWLESACVLAGTAAWRCECRQRRSQRP